jgi:2-C-methyl-D-erythritol 2,4-cyclodiphosphate synthase
MDALLGAAGMEDIGHHFPPDDERYRGAASLDLLARVRDLLAGQGYQIGNVDVVVVAESPRIAPHIPDMRRRISAVLRIPVEAIGIKATTNEGVGPEGRHEAISARAVAAIQQ